MKKEIRSIETKISDSLQTERVILGIDPGTRILGYGIIKCMGKKMELVCAGVVRLEKYEDHGTRLKIVFERCTSLIQNYGVKEVAIEAPFFGKNVQSMLKLGRAQGVAIAAGMMQELPITEYAPRKIKMAITGKGSAGKEQVAAMLKHILAIKEMPSFLDATDGLAAAVCHFYQSGPNKISLTTKKSVKKTSKGKKDAWADYLNKNPEKINKT